MFRTPAVALVALVALGAPLPGCTPGAGPSKGAPDEGPRAAALSAAADAAPPSVGTPARAASPEEARLDECCRQCAQAAGRDPAGMDISTKLCTTYRGAEFNGGPGVDDACADLLGAGKVLLGDCWERARKGDAP